MSRFLSPKYAELEAYVPGEQPQDQQYIKLNTNESPYPPSERAVKMAAEAIKRLHLYPDPDCSQLRGKLATLLQNKYGLKTKPENLIITNGSDEILNFAFMAYCGEDRPAVFPDITYGFYSVFADVNGVPYREVPLDDNFRIKTEDYIKCNGTVFIANPNAHTGIALSRDEIEEIVKADPDRAVIIDEAYVDFGAESCIPLVEKYDNLMVVQTFSKSRSMAGARLGFAFASEEMIQDVNTIRNSTNPYNINSMTMAAGIGTIEEEEYTQINCRKIIETRKYTTERLMAMGFTMTDSVGNFIFMKHAEAGGNELYEKLKEKGILVRHFNKERIREYNRVTIGSREQMEKFIEILGTIPEVIK